MAKVATRVVLGQAMYQATQTGDELLLLARGVHPTTGFREFFEIKDLKASPPTFTFFFIKPGGVGLDVVTPFQHHEQFGVEGTVEVALIEDANGLHKIRVVQIGAVAGEASEDRAFKAKMILAAGPRSCAERVRNVVGAWAGNQDFSDDQALEEIIRGRPCDNGQCIALSQALRAEFGVDIDVTCSTAVVHIIRRICG